MIKYHGTPITPFDIFNKYMKDRNVLIPFPDKRDFNRATEYASKIIIDNGAFSVWKKGIKIDWNDYYDWIDTVINDIEYFFIPDVIGGTEQENDMLIESCKERYKNRRSTFYKAIPVWHVDESLNRLAELVLNFGYIAFGSSGEYSVLGTKEWHNKVSEAMSVCCDTDGKPKVKIHMLRCLNKNIFKHYPFYSGDSTTFAQNHKKYYNKYKDTETDGRIYLLNSLHKYNSPLILNQKDKR